MTVKVKLSVTEKDLGLKHILKEVQKLKKKPTVDVGVRGASALKPKKSSDGKTSDINLVDVATIHEYGGGNVPERSFIRSTMDENKNFAPELEGILDRVFDVSSGITTEKGLAIVGELAKAAIQNKIRSNLPPELAASTIARREAKGDSNPVALIDTGQLLQGITYKVKKTNKAE